MAIAYVARGKVITSVRLDTAGINKKNLHMALPPVPTSILPSIVNPTTAEPPCKHLGLQTTKIDGLRETAREKSRGSKPGKRKKRQ